MRKSRYQKGSVKKQRGRWVAMWWVDRRRKSRVIGLVKEITKSAARTVVDRIVNEVNAKGVWYRGPFGHNGSAATLEDWLDPSRIKPDYVPTGYRGYDGKTRSIPGHRFGLGLSPGERRDLIAFLNTL